MAWTDKPTDTQIDRLYFWMQSCMTQDEARDALNWLKDNRTRRDASEEIKRLYPIHKNRSFTKMDCFKSRVWEGYSGRSI